MNFDKERKFLEYQIAWRNFQETCPDIDKYVDTMIMISKTNPPSNQHTRDPYEIINEVYLKAKAIVEADEWDETYVWIDSLTEDPN